MQKKTRTMSQSVLTRLLMEQTFGSPPSLHKSTTCCCCFQETLLQYCHLTTGVLATEVSQRGFHLALERWGGRKRVLVLGSDCKGEQQALDTLKERHDLLTGCRGGKSTRDTYRPSCEGGDCRIAVEGNPKNILEEGRMTKSNSNFNFF